jgi:succinoglycan biosynthesis transport protein ExoP
VLEYEITQIDEEVKLTKATLTDVRQELANTPQILVTNKSLSKDAYLHSVVAEQNNTSSAEAGSIQLKDEQLYPLYISLQKTEPNLNLEISRLENRKEEIQEKITNNQLIVKENLSVVSPAIEPEVPVGPKKLLNVAITGVVGGMTSLFAVFIMHYWRSSAPVSSSAGR